MKKKLGIITAIVLSLIFSFTVVFADTYTVKTGDVLWKIAQENGMTLDEIKAMNNLDNPNSIYPSQVLKIGGNKTIASTNLKTTLNLETPINLKTPRYVFMFIGDGLGFSQRQFSEYYLQTLENDKSKKLLMNTFDVSGINTTHSANILFSYHIRGFGCSYGRNRIYQKKI